MFEQRELLPGYRYREREGSFGPAAQLSPLRLAGLVALAGALVLLALPSGAHAMGKRRAGQVPSGTSRPVRDTGGAARGEPAKPAAACGASTEDEIRDAVVVIDEATEALGTMGAGNGRVCGTPPRTSAPSLPVPVSRPRDASEGFRVQVADARYFGNVERARLEQKIVPLIERVVRSDEFRERVLNHTWNGKRQFADNQGLTNEQIYERILAARETGPGGAEGVMDLELEMYDVPWWKRKFTSVVAYTYPNRTKIWLRRDYFAKSPDAWVAGTLVHEWLHRLGFEHNDKDTWDYTVPYAVGNMVVQLAGQN